MHDCEPSASGSSSDRGPSDRRRARYRTHTCGVLRPEHVGQTVRLAGWVHRKRDHGQLLFIDLRDHYGVTQCVVHAGVDARSRSPKRCRLESVIGVDGRGHRRARRRTSTRRCRPATSRSWSTQIEVLSTAETLPFQVAGTPGDSRGAAAALPLPRSAPREAAREHRAALAGHREHPPAHERAGLPRVPDADPDLELARGRARLPRAEPHAPGQVLRAAAGAAAVQAAPDGGRASIATSRSRRASATRTRAPIGRPASSTSSTSRCRSSRRTTCSRRSSRCWPACSASSPTGRSPTPPFPRIAYDDAMAMYGTRQAGPAEPDPGGRRHRGLPRVRVRGLRARRSRRAPSCARFPRRAPPSDRAASSTRPSALGESLGLGGLAYIVAAETPQGPLAKYLPEERRRAAVRGGGRRAGDAVFFAVGTGEEPGARRSTGCGAIWDASSG